MKVETNITPEVLASREVQSAFDKQAELVKRIKEAGDTISLGDTIGGEHVVEAKLALVEAEKRYNKAKLANPKQADIDKARRKNFLPRETTATIFSIPTGKYLLCYDPAEGGRAYIRPESESRFAALVKDTKSPMGADRNVRASIHNASIQDLTQAEFDKLLTAKPSLETILSVYTLAIADNMTFANEGKPPTVVW